MRDKNLEHMLDDWGASEAMSAPPLPSSVSSRLGRIRAQRAATAGACVVAALALLIALGFSLSGAGEDAPVSPPPEAPADVLSETTVNPTIGEIYSLNNGLRAGADGEIVLPVTDGLGDGERAPMTVRSTLPD